MEIFLPTVFADALLLDEKIAKVMRWPSSKQIWNPKPSSEHKMYDSAFYGDQL
jgi:hypothetical protein